MKMCFSYYFKRNLQCNGTTLKYDVSQFAPLENVSHNNLQLHQLWPSNETTDIFQLIVNGRAIHVFDEHEVAKIPWELAGVNYVVEASEALTSMADAKLHLKTTQVCW